MDSSKSPLQGRLAKIYYTGDNNFDTVFDEVVEVFEKHGLKIEVASDGPDDEDDSAESNSD